MLEIKDPQTAIDASSYRFNKLEWTNTNAGLLKKCVDARVDLNQFQTISDAIASLYVRETDKYFNTISYIYLFGHIVPLLMQVSLQNDSHLENFRTSGTAAIIYIAAVVSMITQIYLASLEVKSR